MHAKYEVSISYGSKVIAKVKVDNRQTDKQTDRRTGQKQYAPDHSIRGHKNVGILLDRSWSHDAVKIRLVFNADAMNITIFGVEIRIGCVIEFEAGDEQSKMADDELVAMDLWQ